MELVFPSSLTLGRKGTFSSCDLEHWPMTLTYELDLGWIKGNH